MIAEAIIEAVKEVNVTVNSSYVSKVTMLKKVHKFDEWSEINFCPGVGSESGSKIIDAVKRLMP